MAAPPRPTAGTGCSRWLRWCYAAVLGLLLLCGAAAVLAGLGFLDVPNLLVRPLLRKAQAQGIQIEFGRAHIDWQRGLFVESLRLTPTREPADAGIRLANIVVRPALADLRRFAVRIAEIEWHDGRLSIPLPDPEKPGRQFDLEMPSAQLRFFPDDRMEIEAITARALGTRLHVSGTLTNIWALVSEASPARRDPMWLETWQSHLKVALGVADRFAFSKEPELRLDVSGDAGDPVSLTALVQVRADHAVTPWGKLDHLHGQGNVGLAGGRDGNGLFMSRATLDFAGLQTAYSSVDEGRMEIRWAQGYPDLIPPRVDWQLDAVRTTFEQGSARQIRLAGHVARVDQGLAEAMATADWAWWALLEPYSMQWSGHAEELIVHGITAERVEMAARWRAPMLELGSFEAESLGRKLELQGTLDVDSRQIHIETRFDLDWRRMDSLFTGQTGDWLESLVWVSPPRVEATLDMAWPGWNREWPDWRMDLMPGARLSGSIRSGPIGYRGLSAEHLEAHYTLSNGVWHVPDMVVRRPEGDLELACTGDVHSGDYHVQARSRITPHVIEPLLGIKEDKVVDLFQFRVPPAVEAELWGRWDDPARTGVQASVEATDFSFRDEDIDKLAAVVRMTNAFLHATDVQVQVGDEWIHAPGVGFDLRQHWLYLTNATTRMDPQRIGRAIGPKTAHDLSPYQFLNTPHARVDGSVNVRDTRQSDMRFELTGGPFHYWRFQVPEVHGTVLWFNETIVITNLNARFYEGKLDANIHAAIPHGQDSRVRFHAIVSRADLQGLAADLLTAGKRLEGTLNLNLTITDAIADDPQSWQGFGRADLQDGFLWDIPMFGLLSPVLNSIVPGIGHSRINGATATFSVTNSIVHSDDLELRAPLFRLAYRGAVDLNGRVHARVEARLLRDAWVVGPLVSLLFSPLTKLFEYQVTGTLSRPEMELLYIPKPLQLPLDPVGTIRDMFEDNRAPGPLP